jgi:hypothetical protein
MPSQPAKFSLWAATVRVVLCALLGAIAVSVAPLMPMIIHESAQGWSGERGAIPYWLVLGVDGNMFFAPWGGVGALVGAVLGWLTVRARRVQNRRKAGE